MRALFLNHILSLADEMQHLIRDGQIEEAENIALTILQRLHTGQDHDLVIQFTSQSIKNAILYTACKNGMSLLAEVALAHGADAGTRDIQGDNTVLHVTAMYGYTTLAFLLIQAGANITAVNKNFQTPYDLAHPLGQHELSRLLSPSISGNDSDNNSTNDDSEEESPSDTKVENDVNGQKLTDTTTSKTNPSIDLSPQQICTIELSEERHQAYKDLWNRQYEKELEEILKELDQRVNITVTLSDDHYVQHSTNLEGDVSYNYPNLFIPEAALAGSAETQKAIY